MKKSIAIAIAVLVVVLSGVFFGDDLKKFFFASQSPPKDVAVTDMKGKQSEDVEEVATGLKVPWDMAFLPEGDFLVTERPGTLLRIGDGQRRYEISGVRHIGEGGLLGIALHPDFSQNRFVYLYFTSQVGGQIENRVERYRFENDELSGREVILSGIPGASYHDGGRIEFGPDGFLYITTGDAGNAGLAQNKNSLAGKILRLNDDGATAADNPFGNAVWSYGHRNPQGLVWDGEGRLWSTEHGRSGALSGFDELNIIEKGGNYGWPTIQGDERKEGMNAPVLHSGSDYTWAPASATYYDGSIFFGGLRGEALFEAVLSATSKPELKIHFREEYGRVRMARMGDDGFLYISTSNTDGRGTPGSGDDRILKINPEIFR
ncbi:MAG: PQQ-dependent sugar dehydrogenase [bacterium]|nr:PQQ-dependent sugar dehydrogenase [bacterium]